MPVFCAAYKAEARCAAAFGIRADVDCDARARLYRLDLSLGALLLWAEGDALILGGVGLLWCPSSDVPLPAERGVIVPVGPWRLGRSVEEPAESLSELDSDDVESDAGVGFGRRKEGGGGEGELRP